MHLSNYLPHPVCRYRWAKVELDRDEVYQVHSAQLHVIRFCVLLQSLCQ